MEFLNDIQYEKISKEYSTINPDLIIEPFKEFDDAITCSICTGLLWNPIRCKTCLTMFCKQCISKWKSKSSKCPMNCGEFQEDTVDRNLKNMLEKFKLYCPNNQSGCISIINYNDFIDHVNKYCDFIRYKCKLCNQEVNKKDIENHYNNCPVICINNQQDEILCDVCKGNIKNKNYVNHFNVCLKKMTNIVNNLSNDLKEKNQKINFLESQLLKIEIQGNDHHTDENLIKRIEMLSNQVTHLMTEIDSTRKREEFFKSSLEKMTNQADKLNWELNELKKKDYGYKSAYEQWKNHAENLKNQVNNLNKSRLEYKLAYEQWKAYADKLRLDLTRQYI